MPSSNISCLDHLPIMVIGSRSTERRIEVFLSSKISTPLIQVSGNEALKAIQAVCGDQVKIGLLVISPSDSRTDKEAVGVQTGGVKS